MILPRVLPCLLLKGQGLVKTTGFRNPVYIGDPINAVRIFNEKEVDELVILDISASPEERGPNLELLREIVSEAFMPVAYGGGVQTLEQARAVFSLGVEKIVLGTKAVDDPSFIEKASSRFGSQSVLACIDVKRSLFGKPEVYACGGRRRTRMDPVAFARQVEQSGAGEIVVNSIDRDGTMKGFDLNLIRAVTDVVNVPVVACGGAGSLSHVHEAVVQGGASAVAAGSMFVFHGKHRAVLINYPTQQSLSELFARN